MPKEPTDANTEVEQSSASTDANGSESSTEQQQAVEKAVASVNDAAEAETESAPESEVEGEQTEKVVPEGEEQKEEVVPEKPVTLDKPEDEKLPFHKEPRFQELIQEKNQYKEKVAALEPQAKRAQVLDEYVAQYNIQPQQLQSALEYLRLLNTEPQKAYEMLKPTYERLAMLSGDKLPTDLQEQVTAGVIPVELAKELAQARSGKEYQAWQSQTQQLTQQQRAELAIQGAIDSWATSTMQRDPDLTRGSDKYNYLDMKLKAMRLATPPRTPEEGLRLTEQAYKETNEFFNKFNAKKIVKKQIQSQQSTQNASAVVKDAKDVVNGILAGKRPHQFRYS